MKVFCIFMPNKSSHRNRIDCIHIESPSRCMEVPVLHLILFFSELGANFVLEFTVGPVAIGITCFSKPSFCLIRIISFGSPQTLEFARIDPRELEVLCWRSMCNFFGFPLSWRSSASGWDTRATFTNVGACSLSLFDWDLQFIGLFILSLLARLFLLVALNFLSLNLCDELFPSVFIISEILLDQIF